MRPKALVHAACAALALAGTIAACDSSPTAPTRSSGTQGTPPGSPPTQQPMLTRLELVGPASLPPAGTAKFTANAVYTDGSTRDVSAESAWRTQHSSVLSISPQGVATAHDRGRSFLEASFGGKSSGKYVMVLPDGTFLLSGLVYEAGLPVSGAQVAVSAGAAQGLTTTTGSVGAYSLFGVSGDAEIRVTKPAYEEQKKRLHVASHQALNFDLRLSGQREVVEGAYTLTIAAAPECRSILPDELMERRYVAQISQVERRLTVTLQGTAFYEAGAERRNTFRGQAEPERLTFQLGGAYYYAYWGSVSSTFPDVFEQLTASTYFAMSGSAVVTGSGSRRSGTLDGAMEALGGPPRFDRIASCSSSGHRFELTR